MLHVVLIPVAHVNSTGKKTNDEYNYAMAA